ncbi:MAG TPA: OsmC family protein [Anaerolineae bacterium]|nr:OsmC family protein [Anaerolineae bacterium]HQH39404.1 OsmC family protein [Anaerolineae bacterium]
MASAVWEGNLVKGKGELRLGSGAFEGAYSFASRFENGMGTNPEELIGAAHAGCFSMALSHMLAEAGFIPTRVATRAAVKMDKVGDGFKIVRIDLTTAAEVPGIDEATFLEHANAAKTGCPVSQALASVEVTLTAQLAR